MTSLSRQPRGVAVDATPHRLPSRVEIAWDMTCGALASAPQAIRDSIVGAHGRTASARLVALMDLPEQDAARVTIRVERGDAVAGATVLVANMAPARILRDESVGLVHVDVASDALRLSVTLRSCRDGVTLLYARSSVFETLGVPGGRVEPPRLRAVE